MISPEAAEEKAFLAAVIFSSLPKESRYFIPANTKKKSDINAITESRYCIATITAPTKLSTLPARGLQKIPIAGPQRAAAWAVFARKTKNGAKKINDMKYNNIFLDVILLYLELTRLKLSSLK